MGKRKDLDSEFLLQINNDRLGMRQLPSCHSPLDEIPLRGTAVDR